MKPWCNPQMDPTHPEHLRWHPLVVQWIAALRRDDKDCRHCGWPHSEVLMCGAGSAFGQFELGGHTFYVATDNVDYSVKLFQRTREWGKKLGRFWFRRDGKEIVVTHIETFNNCPQVVETRVPRKDFLTLLENI